MVIMAFLPSLSILLDPNKVNNYGIKSMGLNIPKKVIIREISEKSYS
jgi:hypothetical protein